MDVLKRNNVSVSGTGSQALVFVHGFGCDQRMWRLVAPAFEDRYRVVLLDLVGAGQSDLTAYDPARYSTLDGHADDVLAVLAALDLHHVAVVGHSVSAMIAVLAALREPTRIDRLVLVGPSPRYINDAGYTGGFEQADIEELLEAMDQNYLGWSGAITPVIMGHPERPELAAELNASFCRTDPAIARHFARVTFLSDNRADVAALAKRRLPVLIVQCAHDAIAPVAVGEYLHRQLPASELVVLDTTGHCPHLSVPQATIDAIDQFLAAARTAEV
ncbi:alpha/beta hydrolase [Hymenobacter busanensis]|uniref:Alpha/beta hydrolase n=1 Tax=Hymenobacter busanensis TaxID=2607656 RepID=A0A7L4ZT87_9BACT|nr:alpha/beta hydrolase [Hymenobacter busanensis]KAA9327645.1 alpha/beta hydrolase [Hymenobacter busanensis]QHJ06015.1 alpha/beta fold hydrolase [Hymenobacter busanensis]